MKKLSDPKIFKKTMNTNSKRIKTLQQENDRLAREKIKIDRDLEALSRRKEIAREKTRKSSTLGKHNKTTYLVVYTI